MTTAPNRLNGKPHNIESLTRNQPHRRRRKVPKPEQVLFWSATVVPWGLAILLLMVSMPHLANGFQTICHCGTLAGWLLAVAIDSAQVTAKLQLTVAKNYLLKTPTSYTSTGIVITTALMSMTLNVLAFMEGASGTTGIVLAWVAGIMLPLLIIALSYTGSCFALAKKPRKTNRPKRKQ